MPPQLVHAESRMAVTEVFTGLQNPATSKIDGNELN